MKKLKRFSLPQGSMLSNEELEMLVGGDFYPTDCTNENAACSISVAGGFYTGTCLYGYYLYNGGDTADSSDDTYKYGMHCVKN